jgi:WD40 repeat protein
MVHVTNLTAPGSDNPTLWDRRKLGATGKECCVHTFSLHTEGITTVQWCPDQKGVFASGAEDGYLNVWDVGRIGAPQTAVGLYKLNAVAP